MLFFVALKIKMPVNPQENQMFRPSSRVNQGGVKINRRPNFRSDSVTEMPNARRTGNNVPNVKKRLHNAYKNGV